MLENLKDKLINNKPLVLVLLLGTFLKLFLLNKVPPSLNWDEVSMGYTAYSVSQTGMDEWGERLPLFFRSYGEWKSATYIYLLVPLVKFFGMNAWTVRLPSVIAGIVAVFLTYLIGKKLYNEKVGLWAALFLTITPWHFMLSRPAFEGNVSLTLVLVGIYCLLNAASSNKLIWTATSAVFFGLAPHTYNSAKVVVPFLVLYMVWRTKLYRNIKKIVLLFGILAFFALPLIVNILNGRAQYRYTQVGVTTDQKNLNEFINYRKTLPLPLLMNKLIFNKGTYFLYQFSGNWFEYLSPRFLFIEGGDHNQHSLRYFGVLYLVEGIFLLYGLGQLKKQKSDLRFLPLLIIGLGIIPAAATRENGHVLRSVLSLPGWQLLAGLGVVHLQSILKKNSTLLTFLYLLLATQAVIFLTAYFVWYPRAFARDWQLGYKEVAAYLQEHESEYNKIVFTKWYGESQLFLAFYNNWNPAWYIENNKQNLRYEKEEKLWLDQLDSYSIGKYTFKYIDFPNEERTKDILYVGKFDDFFEDPNTLKTFYFPDGTVSFHIVQGDR